jgi:hypothetical protein
MARPIRAQPPSAALRDSATALLADSLLDEALDGITLPRHALRVRAVQRHFTVAGSTMRETAGPLSYHYSGDRVALMMSGTPVSFSAPAGVLSGATPIKGRVALRLSPGDTVVFTGQTASSPGALNTSATAALGSIATSTIDLDAVSMGLPAAVGVRAVHVQPIDRVFLALDAGVEHQPRPDGTTPIFWRGRTISAGASLATQSGAARWTAGADWSHSWADSLGGQNLFPGGGLVALDASVDGTIGDPLNGRYGAISLFYLRPYQNSRADQPNRLIPQGRFWGVQGDLSLPAGPVVVSPTASLLREASTVDIGTATVPARLDATGWTISASTTVDITVGRVTFSPEIGTTVGGVGTSTATTLRTRRGRTVTFPQQFDDPVRGVWFGLTMRAHW